MGDVWEDRGSSGEELGEVQLWEDLGDLQVPGPIPTFLACTCILTLQVSKRAGVGLRRPTDGQEAIESGKYKILYQDIWSSTSPPQHELLVEGTIGCQLHALVSCLHH